MFRRIKMDLVWWVRRPFYKANYTWKGDSQKTWRLQDFKSNWQRRLRKGVSSLKLDELKTIRNEMNLKGLFDRFWTNIEQCKWERYLDEDKPPLRVKYGLCVLEREMNLLLFRVHKGRFIVVTLCEEKEVHWRNSKVLYCIVNTCIWGIASNEYGSQRLKTWKCADKWGRIFKASWFWARKVFE